MLRLTALRARLLSSPAIIQMVILLMLMYESGRDMFGADAEYASFSFVFLLTGRFLWWTCQVSDITRSILSQTLLVTRCLIFVLVVV